MLAIRWAATALFVVLVPVFLVLTFVRVATVEPRVHEYSFARYDAVATTGVDRVQLDRAAREIIRYFRDDQDLLSIRVLVDGQEQPLFSPREVLHMRDVKALIGTTFRIHELAFVYIVAYVAGVFLWGRERPLRRLAEQLVTAGLVTVGVLGFAAVAVLVGFDSLFEQFHLLSFSNDFWQLSPARDPLIQMYPQGFWFDVTLGVGLLAAASGGLLAVLGYAYRLHEDRSGQAPTVAAERVSEAAVATRGPSA
ncbi:MAG: TIGR01906 family membrane protein [Chloroflexi bacterium]|nr:TIGR01906 family membrane protein [Chloroflexota bacterium]